MQIFIHFALEGKVVPMLKQKAMRHEDAWGRGTLS
jgi:hypothetical protein